MKKNILSAIAVCAALFSCQKKEFVEIMPAYDELHAMTEVASGTRTVMDEFNNVLWSADDQIVAFMKTSLGLKYQLKDSYIGKTSGAFSKVASGSSDDLVSGMELDHIVAYYPYSESVMCSNASGGYALNVVLPSEQTYAPDSFGNGAFPMVAVSLDNNIAFRNVCGGIKFLLKGTQKVRSIKIQGRNDEKLSGAATVTAYADSTRPTISMAPEASPSVTLHCGSDGVQLNESTATEFILALPPTIFSEGFTVTITDTDTKIQTLESDKENTVIRSSLLVMPEVTVETVSQKVPNNQIWYTTNDGQVADLTYNGDFKSLIVSNEYTDGRGVMTFSKEITEVSYHAFWNCKNLTSVNLPESVVRIGSYAFYACENLEEVVIPAEIVSVYNGTVFGSCPNLRRFIGPSASDDGRCLICKNVLVAFASCGLTEYTFPEGVNQLDEYVCCGSKDLKKVIIPDSVDYIRDYAFQSCTSLETVVLSPKITRFFNCVFSGCTSLTTIENTENITDLSYSVFSGCTSLEKVELVNLRYISDNPFYGCTSLSEVISPLTSDDGRCIIDEHGRMVTFIPGGISEYKIPEGVTSIGWGAFRDIRSLQSLTMPDTVTEIESSAFSDCASLETIKFSSNIEIIGSYAFNGCSELKSVTLPSSLRQIRDCAFQGCDNMGYMICYATTPPDLADPENPDWSGLDHLRPEEITILVPSASVQDYKSATHWNKFADVIYALEDRLLFYTTTDGNVIMPESTMKYYIVSNTYDSDGGVMLLDASLTSLDYGAFDSIDNLLSLTIPGCISDMKGSTISRCDSLEYIKFGNGLHTIYGVDDCDNLREIRFSPNNKVIDSYAFRYLDALENVDIPDHIESIGDWAFQECPNLKTVTIGTGLTTLEGEAFFECSNLQTVYIKAVNPPAIKLDPWGTWHAFYGCTQLTIYVPEGSVDVYKAAEGWSDYQDRIVGYDFNE